MYPAGKINAQSIPTTVLEAKHHGLYMGMAKISLSRSV